MVIGLWQRILSVHYSIPDYVRVSKECRHLLSRIFVADPEKVSTICHVSEFKYFNKFSSYVFSLSITFVVENNHTRNQAACLVFKELAIRIHGRRGWQPGN